MSVCHGKMNDPVETKSSVPQIEDFFSAGTVLSSSDLSRANSVLFSSGTLGRPVFIEFLWCARWEPMFFGMMESENQGLLPALVSFTLSFH